jgi:malate/lactate dehydrogenase
MQIAIIGFGETGSCIASLIIHEYSDIVIHVLDPSNDISGRLLDMQHAAAFRNIKITFNNSIALSSADYIFYCAGARNAKDGDRNSVTQQNKELIEVVFGKVKLNSTVKIIVVTNPVELITTWISEYFNHEIVAVGTGTLLDAYRFKFLLSKSLNVLPNEVEAIVIGEHGQGMTPILSQTKVKGKLIQSLLSEYELNELTQELKDSAKTIRLTEQATKYGVSECAVFLMNQFNSLIPIETIASVAVPKVAKDQLEIESPIFVSLACMVSTKGVEVLPLPPVSASELVQLKIACKRLGEVYLKK